MQSWRRCPPGRFRKRCSRWHPPFAGGVRFGAVLGFPIGFSLELVQFRLELFVLLLEGVIFFLCNSAAGGFLPGGRPGTAGHRKQHQKRQHTGKCPVFQTVHGFTAPFQSTDSAIIIQLSCEVCKADHFSRQTWKM